MFFSQFSRQPTLTPFLSLQLSSFSSLSSLPLSRERSTAGNYRLQTQLSLLYSVFQPDALLFRR
jgi:hypothetical protein